MRDAASSVPSVAIQLLRQLTLEAIEESDSCELRELSELCAYWNMRIADTLVRRHLPQQT